METLNLAINFVSSSQPDIPINPEFVAGSATGDITNFILGIIFAVLAVCFLGIFVYSKKHSIVSNTGKHNSISKHIYSQSWMLIAMIALCSILSFSMLAIGSAHADQKNDNTIFTTAYVNEETGEISIDDCQLPNLTGVDLQLLSVDCSVAQQAKDVEGMTNFNFKIADKNLFALYNDTLEKSHQMQDLYVIEKDSVLGLSFEIQNISLDTAKNLIGKTAITAAFNTQEYSPVSYNQITFDIAPAEGGSMDTTPIKFEEGDTVSYRINEKINKIEFTIESSQEVISKTVELGSEYYLNNFSFNPQPSESGIIDSNTVVTVNCTYLSEKTPKAIYSSNDRSLTFVYDNNNYNDADFVYEVVDNTSIDTSKLEKFCFPSYCGGTSTISYLREINTVKIDESFKNCKSFSSISGWFEIGSYFPIVYEGFENLDTTNVTNFYAAFGTWAPDYSYDNETRYFLDLSNLKLDGKDISDMFIYNSLLQGVTFGNNIFSPVNVDNLFKGCDKLKDVDISAFNSENIISYDGMFSNCIPNTITIGDKWSIPLSVCGLDQSKNWIAPDGSTCTSSEIFTGDGGKGAGTYVLSPKSDIVYNVDIKTEGAGNIEMVSNSNHTFYDNLTYSIDSNNILKIKLDDSEEFQYKPVAEESATFSHWSIRYSKTNEEYALNSNSASEVKVKSDVCFIAVFSPVMRKATLDIKGGTVLDVPSDWHQDSEKSDIYYTYFEKGKYSAFDISSWWSPSIFYKEGYEFSAFDYTNLQSYELGVLEKDVDCSVVWTKPENVFVWDINNLNIKEVNNDDIVIYDSTNTETITLHNCTIENRLGKDCIKMPTTSLVNIMFGLDSESYISLDNLNNRNIFAFSFYSVCSNSIDLMVLNDEPSENMFGSRKFSSCFHTNLMKFYDLEDNIKSLRFSPVVYYKTNCYIQDKIIVTYVDE